MLIEKQAASIAELIESVKVITRAFKPRYTDAEEIWFRGHSRRNDSLMPSLYRQDNQKYNYDEASLFERFKALGIPYASRVPASEWEWYFLARHHGLPSRLLDWTENLLVAAFFAIGGLIPKNRLELDVLRNGPRGPARYNAGSPAIWVIDAGSLNLFSIGQDAVAGLVDSPDGYSTPYLPDLLYSRRRLENHRPLAILPLRANPRIVAQQGMFTIHGKTVVSIDKIARENKKVKLARITIDSIGLPWIFHELEVLGISEYSLFPELDAIARHVTWTNQSA